MAFGNIFLLLLTLGKATSVEFPLKFNRNCFVNFVFEEHEYTEYPTELEIPTILNRIVADENYNHSFTIHDVSHLNYSFDMDKLAFEDQLAISDGYFRFISKYRSICDIFLLLTTSFNATTTAIQQSGHGTLDNTLFLVNTKPLDIMEISVFCYYCPDSIGHLHALETSKKPKFSNVLLECRKWNKNGYQQSIQILVQYGFSEKTAEPLKHLIGTVDHNIRMYDAEEETEVYWHLSVKQISASNLVMRNILAATREIYMLLDQTQMWAIYCMESSNLVKISWDIHLRVFDFPSWICVGIVVLGMFLHWTYDSGISTDFVSFEHPKSLNEIHKSGCRLWADQLRVTRNALDALEQQGFALKGVAVKPISEILSKQDSFEFSLIPRERVEEMAKYKLLLPSGMQASYYFPSLSYALSIKELLVVETNFVCGTVSIASRYGFQMVDAYVFRGYLSKRMLNLYLLFQESGLFVHFKKLISFQKSLVDNLNVDDMSTVLSSKTLAMRTPLGILCLGYFVMNLVLLICNVVYRAHLIWSAVVKTLKDLYVLVSHTFVPVSQVTNFEN
ncbi:unnamed protein product [Orchesella dallaii]|uniref:Uncharacterized protein n=1 Tax=Orchesella dallaii TaxID=48710 RepID=A0ABP1PJR0_9HEXA